MQCVPAVQLSMELQAGRLGGSIPDGAILNFYWHNPSGRTVAMGSS